ncbi:MAG: hypothetical protein MI922_21130, partial [Bacteroidales bacterium]|nr:hypothetical protein [Bacteroidales bacterium]
MALETPNSNPWDKLEALLERTQQSLKKADYRNMEENLEAAGQHLSSIITTEAPPLSPTQKDRIVRKYERLMLINTAHTQT